MLKISNFRKKNRYLETYDKMISLHKLCEQREDILKMDISFLSQLKDEHGVTEYGVDEGAQLSKWLEHIVTDARERFMDFNYIHIDCVGKTITFMCKGVDDAVPRTAAGNNTHGIEDLKLPMSEVPVSPVKVVINESRENYLLREIHEENKADRAAMRCLTFILALSSFAQVCVAFLC